MFNKGEAVLRNWCLPDTENIRKKEIEFKTLFKGSLEKNLPLITEWLVEHSLLKYSLICPELNLYYIYNPEEGIYSVLSRDLYEKRIYEIFSSLGRKLSYKQVSSVTYQLELLIYVHPERVINRRDYICFRNGVLDVEKGKFRKHGPDVFLTSRLEFNYDPQVTASQWLRFLNEFTDGNKQREAMLRSWLKLLIHNVTDTQTLLYILGPGGTGKSVIANVATLMVGEKDVLSSSLRSLTSDQFELLNLKDKTLISLSDTEMFSGDISVLKRITGGDLLQGRIKLKQGSFDLYSEALVLIVSNYMLGSTDSSGALDRRLRVLYAGNKPDQRKPLLHRKGNSWVGILVEELSGVFNWIYNCDLEESRQIVIQGTDDDTLRLSNPLADWIKECLEPGEGAYLGYSTNLGPKEIKEAGSRGLIYPFYCLWCKQRDIRPLRHTTFVPQLIEQVPFDNVKKVKRNRGIYIKGIKLRPQVINRDNMYGGPLTITNEAEDQVSFPQQVDQDLYNSYMDLLKKTPLKAQYNKYIRTHLPDLNKLVDVYLESTRLPSQSFRLKLEQVISRSVEAIEKYGAIPYRYKRMGVSPRLLPERYGKTINNTKRIVRDQVYKILSASNTDYVIIDFDLKSCYTSILLGLYPNHLEEIQKAIESKGLWEHLKNEFKERGVIEQWNKPAVKICTYSSFFLGGNKAMMDGILESFRLDLGLTNKEFKDFEGYEELYTLAREVVDLMQNSSVITDFRDVASHIQEAYMEEFLVGPTGHRFKVDKHSFRSAYPNFLQSYEFYILAKATIKTVNKFGPGVEVIGHYHDGNTLAVKEEIRDQVIKYYSEAVNQLGRDLRLSYPQDLEVKCVYGSQP